MWMNAIALEPSEGEGKKEEMMRLFEREENC